MTGSLVVLVVAFVIAEPSPRSPNVPNGKPFGRTNIIVNGPLVAFAEKRPT
jgi:hypothetical protein